MTLRTEDLAPPTADDPRGAGLAASALPITLAGLLPAIVLVLALKREVWTRLAAVVVFAPVAGWTIAALLRYVFGSIDQNFWGVAGGLTLGVLAAGLLMVGLGSLFGRVGLAVGALLALLLGNPLSGLNSAPELLPRGWGELGQLLPQGANATLLRSTAFFSGAGATTAIVVLSSWAVVGAVLVVIAAVRQRRTAAGLNSGGVGLDDRDSLRVLCDAVDPQHGSDELIRRFYTRWFAIDLSVRDLFPPDMDAQRTAFAQAMTWLFSELIAQRAEEPVAFLAQLGRDHRKYGVTQRHYDSMHDALYTTLRSHLIDSWDDKLAEAAHDSLALFIGVMRGAADAETGPAVLRRHGRRAHPGIA